MHLYCFLCIFPSGFTAFTVIPHLLCRLSLSLSPIQELEPGATPFCRGGRCATCYSLGPQAAKQKYLDYDYVLPPKESNLRKGPCWARDGVNNKGCSKIICICQPSRRIRCMLTLFARRLSRRCTKAFVSEICYHSSECSRVYHS